MDLPSSLAGVRQALFGGSQHVNRGLEPKERPCGLPHVGPAGSRGVGRTQSRLPAPSLRQSSGFGKAALRAEKEPQPVQRQDTSTLSVALPVASFHGALLEAAKRLRPDAAARGDGQSMYRRLRPVSEESLCHEEAVRYNVVIAHKTALFSQALGRHYARTALKWSDCIGDSQRRQKVLKPLVKGICQHCSTVLVPGVTSRLLYTKVKPGRRGSQNQKRDVLERETYTYSKNPLGMLIAQCEECAHKNIVAKERRSALREDSVTEAENPLRKQVIKGPKRQGKKKNALAALRNVQESVVDYVTRTTVRNKGSVRKTAAQSGNSTAPSLPIRTVTRAGATETEKKHSGTDSNLKTVPGIPTLELTLGKSEDSVCAILDNFFGDA